MDNGEQAYRDHWATVRASNPDVDADALMDAFLEGAAAFAEANSEAAHDWQSLRERLRE